VLGLPTIRLATSDDAQAIATLSRDAIEHGLRWRYTPARILAAIRSRTANVAVVHAHGGLHAFAIMEYGDTTAHLTLLGVQSTQRRRGLGARLLTWLEDAARVAGIERVDVECRSDNPARSRSIATRGIASKAWSRITTKVASTRCGWRRACCTNRRDAMRCDAVGLPTPGECVA
jgi:ribosomal-protein-alanine N-acetyltransferase